MHGRTRRLGRLVGREEEAKREVARLEAALARARAARPPTLPRVLLTFGRKAGELGQLSSPGKGTFISECLEAAGGVNCLDDLPAEGAGASLEPDTVRLPTGEFDLTGWLEGLEERALRRAMERHDGVKARAAASLGLERNAFRYKLKKYGIEE